MSETPDSTQFVDIAKIKNDAFQWAKYWGELIVPRYLTDYDASILINGLRIIEKVVMDYAERSEHNKTLYLFPLNVEKRIERIKEEIN